MGIRAVQAGALTDAIDRELPEGHGDAVDFDRAAPFRDLARKLGESPAALAHRYALSMPGVATVVLGVKHRVELRECVEAEARGPLEDEVMARIDAGSGRAGRSQPSGSRYAAGASLASVATEPAVGMRAGRGGGLPAHSMSSELAPAMSASSVNPTSYEPVLS